MPTVNDPCSDLIGECVALLFRPLCIDTSGQPATPGDFEAVLSLQGWGQATVPAPGGGFFHAPNGLIEKYTSIESYVDGSSCVWWKLTTCALPANEDSANTIGQAGYRGLPSSGTEYRLAGRFEGQPFCLQFSIDAATNYAADYVDGCIPIEIIETGGIVAPDVDPSGIFQDRVIAAIQDQIIEPRAVETSGGQGQQTKWVGQQIDPPATAVHEMWARFNGDADLWYFFPQIDGASSFADRLAFDFEAPGWIFGSGLDANLSRVRRVGTPTDDDDAATMLWVQQRIDEALEGLSYKDACRVATTGNIDLSSAPATIDGINLNPTSDLFNRRVLVKDQTATEDNGIYEWVDSGQPMIRASDALDKEALYGAAVFVFAGTANNDTMWVQTNASTVVGSPITWSQSAGATYTAQAGGHLGLSGTEFYLIDGPGSGVNADLLDGVEGASFLRSDAADTATELITHDRPAPGDIRRMNNTGNSDMWVSERFAGSNIYEIAPSDITTGLYQGNTKALRYYFASDEWRIGSTDKLFHAGNDGDGSGLDADLWKGRELTVGTTAPGSPATGDIWLDTST